MAQNDFQRLTRKKQEEEELKTPTRRKSVLFGDEYVPTQVEEIEIDPNDVVMDDDVIVDPSDVIADEDVVMDAPSIEGIGREVPSSVRFEISGLDDPRDKLTALRKYYPDAEPAGDGNFVMTDPESGGRMVYNVEGWMPSWGDFAEFAPEAVGIAGSLVGGAGGGALGTLASPVAGNIAGAVAGSGAGYSAGKNLAQSGINWLYGNEDTRDIGDRALDVVGDVGIGAAGEGIGRGVQFAARKALPVLSRTAGKALDDLRYRAGYGAADDPVEAAAAFKAFDDVGAQPTPGMIAGGERGLRESSEARIMGTPEQRGLSRVEDQIATRRNDVLDGVSANGGMSRDASGQLIRESIEANRDGLRAASNAAYDELDNLVGSNPVTGTATKKWLTDKTATVAGMGESAKLNAGRIYGDALEQGKAIVADLDAGASFNQIKEARTMINDIAWGSSNKTESTLMKELSESLTKDMAETAKAAGEEVLKKWNAANTQYRAMLQRQGSDSLRQMDRDLNRESSAAIYNLVANGTKNNFAQANRILGQVRQGGGENAVRDVTRSVLDRVGVDNAGQFTATRFAKDWDTMTPEAKSMLAKYSGNPDLLARMNELSAAYKQLAKYTNQKGTFAESNARRLIKNIDRRIDSVSGPAMIASAMTGHVAAPVALAAYKGAKFIFDRAGRQFVDDPQLARWLAGVARSTNPAREIGKLGQIAQRTKSEANKAAIRDLIANWDKYSQQQQQEAR